MRNTRNCILLRQLSALAVALCLSFMGLAQADDLAADLGGGYQAAESGGQGNDIAADLGGGYQAAESGSQGNDIAADLGGGFQGTDP